METNAEITPSMTPSTTPRRIVEPDGAALDVFSLPLDTASSRRTVSRPFRTSLARNRLRADHSRRGVGDPRRSRADAHQAARRLSHRRLRRHAFSCLHRREQGIARAADVSRTCTAQTHVARRTLSPAKHELRADVVGTAIVQRRRRTADHRAAAQSLPRRGDGQSPERTGLVAPRAVGQVARALVWPARTRSHRSFSRPVARRLTRRAFEFDFPSVHLKGETSCR